MENPLLNNYSNSTISRNAGVRTNLSQTNSQLFNVSANLMPTERQTSVGVFNPGAVTQTALDKRRFSMPQIFHPDGAPSGISSENFLLSKSITTPIYNHDIAQTKYARISSWLSEEPRFTKKVSILA